MSKVSARTGLIYTFTKDPDPTNTTADAWFWAALDFRTGALVWKQLAGTGFNYNNHYAGIVLSRDGTAYLGAVGGLLRGRGRLRARGFWRGRLCIQRNSKTREEQRGQHAQRVGVGDGAACRAGSGDHRLVVSEMPCMNLTRRRPPG